MCLDIDYGLNSLLSPDMVSYRHSYTGANIRTDAAEKEMFCFKVEKQVNVRWSFTITFALKHSTSYIILRVPEDVRNYLDYLELSHRFGSVDEQGRTTLVELRTLSVPGVAGSTCNRTASVGRNLEFFCHYENTKAIELRGSGMFSKFTKFRGLYCLKIFHGMCSLFFVLLRLFYLQYMWTLQYPGRNIAYQGDATTLQIQW